MANTRKVRITSTRATVLESAKDSLAAIGRDLLKRVRKINAMTAEEQSVLLDSLGNNPRQLIDAIGYVGQECEVRTYGRCFNRARLVVDLGRPEGSAPGTRVSLLYIALMPRAGHEPFGFEQREMDLINHRYEVLVTCCGVQVALRVTSDRAEDDFLLAELQELAQVQLWEMED